LLRKLPFFERLRRTVYVKIYDPALINFDDHRLGTEFTVVDRKNSQQVLSSNGILFNEPALLAADAGHFNGKRPNRTCGDPDLSVQRIP
jgi:hypothetical protein